NTDNFQQCLLPDDEQTSKLLEKYHQRMSKKKWSIYRRIFFTIGLRRLYEWYHWQTTQIKFMIDFDNLDKTRFKNYKSKYLPNLSAESRSRISLQLYLNNKFSRFMHLNLLPTWIVFMRKFYLDVTSFIDFDGWYFNLWLIIDSILIIVAVIFSLQVGFLLAAVHGILFASINTHEIKKLNLGLKKVCRKILHKSDRKVMIMYPIIIFKIYQKHLEICSFTMKMYKKFWSKLFLGLYLISIPLNVLCFIIIRDQKLGLGERFLIYYITFIHTISLILYSFMISRSNVEYHWPKKCLATIIHSINQPRLKIKLNGWYDRLIHGPEYVPTIFILGTMSDRLIFQMILAYIGLFIFILSRLRSFYESNLI
ncbi:hypothetical protein DERP_000143, partial [Dermatophagoides pteronyssinus]